MTNKMNQWMKNGKVFLLEKGSLGSNNKKRKKNQAKEQKKKKKMKRKQVDNGKEVRLPRRIIKIWIDRKNQIFLLQRVNQLQIFTCQKEMKK